MQRKLASPFKIRQILAEFNLKPSKRFGQNFISDYNIVLKTVQAAEVNEKDVVIEIGPGLGGLTEIILQTGAEVYAVELDRAIHPVLVKLFEGNEKLHLVEADALKLDVDSIGGKPNKLVANLPYNIAAPLMVDYLHKYEYIGKYVVMIQKEVADRILARPATTEYGGLSIKLQLMADIKMVAKVSNNAFIPRPKIDSAIIKLDRRSIVLDSGERERFFAMISAAFSQKRKTVLNSLSSGLGLSKSQTGDLLQRAGIDVITRPQDIGVHDYLELFSVINDADIL